MKYVVCVIRDSASDGYGVPVFFKTTGMAIRTFTDEVNRAEENNQLYRHPEDFALWELGSYEDEQATFDLTTPRQLARGQDVVLQGEKGSLKAVS